MQKFIYKGHIPYYAQIASPDLAGEIFSGEMSAEQDPRWAETGAENIAEYAHWVDRACGIVCLKMCIEAFGGKKEPLMYWIKKGLEKGGYLIKKEKDGSDVEYGWIHAVLAQMLVDEGYSARACPVSAEEICSYIKQGSLLIASVTYQLGTMEKITRNNGHLVVVHGCFQENGETISFLLHNPSGRNKPLQENAHISYERFVKGYSGRAIIISG